VKGVFALFFVTMDIGEVIHKPAHPNERKRIKRKTISLIFGAMSLFTLFFPTISVQEIFCQPVHRLL
jgi:hypothetical protein